MAIVAWTEAIVGGGAVAAALVFPAEGVQSSSSSSLFIRYRARVAYDGSGFYGFQLQRNRPNCRTVQGVLETALNRRLLSKKRLDRSTKTMRTLTENDVGLEEEIRRVIKVVAASRTDTGVHARGQAIHFDVPAEHTAAVTFHNSPQGLHQKSCRNETLILSSVCESINALLTPDVRIWNLQRVQSTLISKPIDPLTRRAIQGPVDRDDVVDNDEEIASDPISNDFQWNVLFDSTYKLYSYRLSLCSVMSPMERHTRWHPPNADKIQIDQLQRILQYYVGTHDFRAFAGAVERSQRKLQKRTEQNIVGGTSNSRDGGSNSAGNNVEADITISTIRTVYSVDFHCEDEPHGLYRIDFRIKGALYKQIRNMVGTAMDVCHGFVSEDHFLSLLRQQQSSVAWTRVSNRSKPAPPEGLTLEMVFFDDLMF